MTIELKRLIVFFSMLFISNLYAQSVGWRITDRFYGFRYELHQCDDLNFEKYLQDLADEMGCFGWVQRLSLHRNSASSTTSKLVGEARCSKIQGPLFENRIKHDCYKSNDSTAPTSSQSNVLVHKYVMITITL